MCVKMVFLGQHRTGLSKNVKIFSFGIFYGNINVSTESAKKPTTFDLLFLIAIYSVKNGNKHLSEIRIKHQNSYLTLSVVVAGLRPILMTDLKCWLSVKLFAGKQFYIKKKSVKTRVISYIFRRQWFIKDKDMYLCALPE